MKPSKPEAGRAVSVTLPSLEIGVVSRPPAEEPGAFASKWGTLVAAVLLSICGAVVAFVPLHTDRPSAGEAAPQADRRSGEVIALGRLWPKDDVVTVATSYGAGDARFERSLVVEGDHVVEGRGTTTIMVTHDPADFLWRIESSRWKTERLLSATSTQASMRRMGAVVSTTP